MMTADRPAVRQYPWTTSVHDRAVTLRLMTPQDKDALLEFVRSLPEDDLLFLSIDLTRPEAVEQWVRYISTGRITTVLLEHEGKLMGHGSLGHNELVWTRHLGEIQLLVSPKLRGLGMGALLANEVFDLARQLGLRKIVARMAAEQKGALQVFERLGFRPEALLADYVIDREGRTHDLIVMSYDVTGLTLE